MSVLIALEIAALLLFGGLTALRMPVFAYDEEAHFAYVRTLADEHRLPVLLRDHVPLNIRHLADSGYQKRFGRNYRPLSYEAFQPPLYYGLAAPVLALPLSGRAQLTAVRLFDLVLLLGSALVLWLLAGRAVPEHRQLGFAFGLAVLLWPGVLVRAVTVSNAGLELLLALTFLYLLWRADTEDDGRFLLAAGAVLGLGLLTKLTLVYLVALLVLVATRHVWRKRRGRSLAAAVATLALPLVLMAPWIAFNEHYFGSPTANRQARDEQIAGSYPHGYSYGLGQLKRDVPRLVEGVEPEEWRTLPADHPALGTAFDFLRAAFFGAPVLALLAAPRWLRSREAGLLFFPWVLVLVLLVLASLVANWSIILPRYTYSALPALGLFGGLAWQRISSNQRVPLLVLGGSLACLAAAWMYAASGPLGL